jgi:hypothetical protein
MGALTLTIAVDELPFREPVMLTDWSDVKVPA